MHDDLKMLIGCEAPLVWVRMKRLISHIQFDFPLKKYIPDTEADFLSHLDSQSFDVILLGYDHPQKALELLKRIRTYDALTPVIFLSQDSNVNLVIEAFKNGVHEYLRWDEVTNEGLQEAINHVVKTHSVRLGRRWSVSEDFIQATRDPLTGLANRYLLQERMEGLMSSADRDGELLAVLYFNLDHFGKINERHGRHQGDQLLSLVARRLQENIRPEDVAARWGGNEFVVVAGRFLNTAEVKLAAERLQHVVSVPLCLAESTQKITASLGISLYPTGGREGKDLLRHACSAMMRAKKRGGDDVEFFHERSIQLKSSHSRPLKKILIVEDDGDTQLLLKKRLQSAGYECEGAVSVEAALKSVPSLDPDLVILDLGFRNASGAAFLQNLPDYIAKGGRIPPVLVVSGHSDPEVKGFISQLGAAGFISKPFDSSEIITTIQSLIH